ncbi:MAG: ribosomal protein S18-alanine N-acetyltransferase [Pseudomonadota bacterium]
MEKNDLQILRATQKDLVGIVGIEKLAFSSPWSFQDFENELTRPWACLEVLRKTRGCDLYKSPILAFMDYWLIPDEIQLLKIATHPDHLRQGLGIALMEHLVSKAKEHAITRITLEVRTLNVPAILLYERFSFKHVGVRPKYYPNGEDALLMDLQICSGKNF